MRIVEIPRDECEALLQSASVGRLACALDNQPYIVPVCFAYDPERLYLFSTVGQKIEWMRQNPNVCLQVDEIKDRSIWASVIVNGTYLELREPQYSADKARARERLSKFTEWWRLPLAERRERVDDLAVEPVFFRIEIASMSGLRSAPEA
jgi:nitroimidazol reductase NimA-like FMN-containing flavoprotein (pyridoxamine 5'-phosphate oxidase superfamily)